MAETTPESRSPATEEHLRCPVCRGEKHTFIRDVFDDRYGYPGLFQLVRCRNCGHIMTSPGLNEEALPELYGTYYPRENLSIAAVESEARRVRSKFARLHRWWTGTGNQGQYAAKADDKMLDIGCGSGLSLLEAREMGVDAWGIEADPNVKRFADALNLRIHQGSLQDKPFEDVRFDLVIMNQVIEHMPEPDEVLLLVRSRLASHGRAVLVFPNIRSLWCRFCGPKWINWHIPYHLHHFSAQTFSQMADRCGFVIVNRRTITPNVWTILQLRSIGQKAERGRANPLWAVSASDSPPSSQARSRFSLAALARGFAMTCIAIFNRGVDSLAMGDSLIVELRVKDSE